MKVLVASLALMLAISAAACGDAASPRATATPDRSTAAPAATAGVATSVAAFPGVATAAAGIPPAVETPAPPPPPTPLPTLVQTGESGIAGVVTIGPTCPVQRIDSPCPDRPYEAAITFWRGAARVAETRSAADGTYSVALPPGTYRVVGESAGTFPHATEQEATVLPGILTRLDIQFDSGIR